MSAARKKLYIIGIDSVPLDLIKKLSKSSDLKGFDEFLKHGFLGDLESTIPPDSASAWPSIYTGLEPREHGVIDFLHLDSNYTKQLIYYDVEKHKPFWDLLAKRGIKSLIITPSMVLSPSSEPNVDMITGWPLEPRFSSKKLEAAAKKFGFAGEPEIGIDLDKGSMPLEKGCRMYVKSIKARSEMSKQLIAQKDYDLIFVCFTETDRIHHYSFSHKHWEEFTLPLYKSVSDFIEWTVEQSKKDGTDSSIMLVSDHGAQPIEEKFLINSWLIEQGYATLKDGVVKQQTSKKKDGVASAAKKFVAEKAMKWKMRRIVYHKMPSFMKRMAERVMEDNFMGDYGGDYTKIAETDFDMLNTKAFAAISHGPTGMIWINDSRFSRPGAKLSEKAKLKKEIMAKLMAMHVDDKKLIKRVVDGATYYKGVKDLLTPDIIFELRPSLMVDFGYHSAQTLFMEPEVFRSGDHTMNGIIGVFGKDTALSKSKIRSVMDFKSAVMKYFA